MLKTCFKSLCWVRPQSLGKIGNLAERALIEFGYTLVRKLPVNYDGSHHIRHVFLIEPWSLKLYTMLFFLAIFFLLSMWSVFFAMCAVILIFLINYSFQCIKVFGRIELAQIVKRPELAFILAFSDIININLFAIEVVDRDAEANKVFISFTSLGNGVACCDKDDENYDKIIDRICAELLGEAGKIISTGVMSDLLRDEMSFD